MAEGALLIVGDDPVRRDYLAMLLAGGGYDSRQARSGEEALVQL